MAIQIYIQDMRSGREENVTDTCLDCECHTFEGLLVTRENLTEETAGYLLDIAFATAQARFGHDDCDVYTR